MLAMLMLLTGAQSIIAHTVTGQQAAYKLGDRGPAGGIVFYDKGSITDGWRYMEAAPSDTHAGIQWYNGNWINVRGTNSDIGTGSANSTAIIASQGSGNHAAMMCRNLTIGGFRDWFLPSLDELDLMYQNLKKNNLGGLGDGWYWSSSQLSIGSRDDSRGAWAQRFSGGSQAISSKDDQNAVRAVRVFADSKPPQSMAPATQSSSTSRHYFLEEDLVEKGSFRFLDGAGQPFDVVCPVKRCWDRVLPRKNRSIGLATVVLLAVSSSMTRAIVKVDGATWRQRLLIRILNTGGTTMDGPGSMILAKLLELARPTLQRWQW
jgi:hypothetical protein